VLIAMIGNVFSPYFAAARRDAESRGETVRPEDFVTLNAILYDRKQGRFCLTEGGASLLDRNATTLRIGASRVVRDGDGLLFWIDEKSAVLGEPLRGVVRFTFPEPTADVYPLDPAGRHRWTPYAPVARCEAFFEEPRLDFRGSGYVDGNDGDEPLERGFTSWDWCRAEDDSGNRVVIYDTFPRDSAAARPPGTAQGGEETARTNAAPQTIARSGRDDLPADCTLPPRRLLPSTLFQMDRAIRCDVGREPRVLETMEDAPFYARSLVETTLFGRRMQAVHETVNLDRFSARWCQFLIGFRMRRHR
jgi:carotenoid 1,2-hydratase